mgnify:CR=1 FL=1
MKKERATVYRLSKSIIKFNPYSVNLIYTDFRLTVKITYSLAVASSPSLFLTALVSVMAGDIC